MDAEFVWTEPHSKRIKVRLTVQREFSGAIVEGSFIVHFVVQFNMCPDCAKANTNQEAWTACVQVWEQYHLHHIFPFCDDVDRCKILLLKYWKKAILNSLQKWPIW